MFEPAEEKAARSGDATWQKVYYVGAAAAVIAALVFRRNLSAEISLFAGQMPPTTAEDWFSLLQSAPLLGLTLLNLFDVVNAVLLGVIFLALHPVAVADQPARYGARPGAGRRRNRALLLLQSGVAGVGSEQSVRRRADRDPADTASGWRGDAAVVQPRQRSGPATR